MVNLWTPQKSNPPGVISAYRFHDSAALNLPGGATLYLTATAARRLARALNRVAASCQGESFGDSKVGTIHIAPDAAPRSRANGLARFTRI